MASLVLFSRWAPLAYYNELLAFLPVAVVIHCAVNLKFGLYKVVDRYAGINQGLKISLASLVSLPLLLASGLLIMPSSRLHVLAMVPIGSAIALILMTGVRFYPRVFYERSLREVKRQLNLLVVGAGSAGEMIVRSSYKEPASAFKVVAIVDDDPSLQGMEIHGVPIFCPTERISILVDRMDIDEILIAIPSATLEEFQRLWQSCSRTGLPTKTLRPLQSLQLGKIGLDSIKEIEIEDLLGRQPVQTDYTQIRTFIRNQIVLVTGAGGSIGSELVTQICHHKPALIVMVDQDESSLYQMHKELRSLMFLDHEICVADIRSESKMESLFRRFQPNLVFHAAAYKHVPLMEMQPDEAVLNNVLGTLNVARFAGEYGAKSFVNISTDKAVEPVNVMGATKKLGERLVHELGDIYPQTRYASVRFGNVLGSRGSVIPIFRKQILEGGPVTVTHPDMTRYFMLVSEAVDLVLQAAAFQDEKAVYVLEMGKPVRIIDLAEQMINLMKQSHEVEITFTGLRPGEKVHEHLVARNEQRSVSTHAMIYKIQSPDWHGTSILPELNSLFEEARDHNNEMIRFYLQKWIPSYTPFDMNHVGLLEPRKAEAEVPAESVYQHDFSYHWGGRET